jgi:hypothetical protein
MFKACVISLVGVRKDGAPRHWCATHRAPANDPEGRRVESCVKSGLQTQPNTKPYRLEARRYSGGVALWGAVPAVYSTVAHDMPDLGVHTHARREPGGRKQVDRTFPEVTIALGSSEKTHDITIGEREAVHYMIAQVLGV